MGLHPYRPSFALLIGKSVRSLVKLEQGEPVGPTVYEAAADHLPGWTRDTPKAILDGDAPPSGHEAQTAEMSAARRRIVEMSHTELALRIAEVAEVEGGEAAGKLLERMLAIRAEARQRT